MGLARKVMIGLALSVAAVMGMTVQAFAADTVVERIYGTEAADTAAAISRYAGGNVGGAVVLARDDDYMDAMSATGLAGALNAPILLTNREHLSPAAADRINQLQPSIVYIIGGDRAVQSGVEGALGGRQVQRVFGTEACDTSVECARIIESLNEQDGIAIPGGVRNEEDTAIVATSVDFADALSVSSYAYKYRLPIFIVGAQTNDSATDRKLPAVALEMLNEYGTALIPGGTAALPEASLDGYQGNKNRIYGTTGYETSLRVARWLINTLKLSGSTIGIASGDPEPKGVDALASASLCALNDAPLVLVDKNTTLFNPSSALLGFNRGNNPSQVYVFGGSAVVSSYTFDKICNLYESESVDPCPPQVEWVASGWDLVNIARNKVFSPGVRYQAGGMGPDAFDCSGFVWWVFNEGNYNLGRTNAQGYYNMSEKIPEWQAQAGDIVAYPADPNNENSIFHVAIYAGDGTVYEAVDERQGLMHNNVNYCGSNHYFGRLAPRSAFMGYPWLQSSYSPYYGTVNYCSVCWEHMASEEEFNIHRSVVHGF